MHQAISNSSYTKSVKLKVLSCHCKPGVYRQVGVTEKVSKIKRTQSTSETMTLPFLKLPAVMTYRLLQRVVAFSKLQFHKGTLNF